MVVGGGAPEAAVLGSVRGAEAARRALALLSAAWEEQVRLAEDLRAALLSRDAAAIQVAVRAQEEAAVVCRQRGVACADALRAACRAVGLAADAPAGELAAALAVAGAAQEGERLAAEAARAADTAARAGRLLSTNTLLLRQGLAFTSFALRCLTGVAEQAPYTASGGHRGLSARRVLDTIA